MEGMFKTAVSGFKKDEVLAYIDKRETEAHQQQEALQQRLRKMTADYNEQKTLYEEAAAQVEQLTAELEKERGRGDELAKAAVAADEASRAAKTKFNDALFETSRLRQENAGLQKERNNIQADKDRAISRIAELDSIIAGLKNKLENSAENEDLIHRVLLEAQISADKLLNDAKEKAAQIQEDAQNHATDIVEQARQEASALLLQTEQFRSEVKELREGTQRAFAHIDTLLENVELSAKQTQHVYPDDFGGTSAPTEEEAAAGAENTDAESIPADEQDGKAPDTSAAPDMFDFSRTSN